MGVTDKRRSLNTVLSNAQSGNYKFDHKANDCNNLKFGSCRGRFLNLSPGISCTWHRFSTKRRACLYRSRWHHPPVRANRSVIACSKSLPEARIFQYTAILQAIKNVLLPGTCIVLYNDLQRSADILHCGTPTYRSLPPHDIVFQSFLLMRCCLLAIFRKCSVLAVSKFT